MSRRSGTDLGIRVLKLLKRVLCGTVELGLTLLHLLFGPIQPGAESGVALEPDSDVIVTRVDALQSRIAPGCFRRRPGFGSGRLAGRRLWRLRGGRTRLSPDGDGNQR